jgi:PAS domain-containing protein
VEDVPVEVGASAEARRDATNAARRFADRMSPGKPAGELVPFGLADQALFNELTGAAHDAFVAFDGAGLIRSWNTAAARMFGYGAQEALGQFTTILVPGAEVEAHRARPER